MPARRHLRRLFDHLEWANRRALEVVRDGESEEARRLLSHLLAAERVWLRRLTTGDSSGLGIWPQLSPGECADLLSENLAKWRKIFRSLSEQDLERDVAYRNSEGRNFRTPAGDILHHVALHGSYHRGQIAQRLRDAGDEPVNTDFITFVRHGALPGVARRRDDHP